MARTWQSTRSPPNDVAEQVRAELLNQRELQSASETFVARQFGWSPRKMQRYLAAHGTSFREVRATVLEERATELLSNAGSSVAGVAAALGYRETNSFRRAYKSWTGKWPSVG